MKSLVDLLNYQCRHLRSLLLAAVDELETHPVERTKLEMAISLIEETAGELAEIAAKE